MPRPPQNSSLATSIVHAVGRRVAEVEVREVEAVRALVVEVHVDRPVLEQLLGRAQLRRRSRALKVVDGGLDAVHAVGLLLEDQLDQQVAGGAVVVWGRAS